MTQLQATFHDAPSWTRGMTPEDVEGRSFIVSDVQSMFIDHNSDDTANASSECDGLGIEDQSNPERTKDRPAAELTILSRSFGFRWSRLALRGLAALASQCDCVRILFHQHMLPTPLWVVNLERAA